MLQTKEKRGFQFAIHVLPSLLLLLLVSVAVLFDRFPKPSGEVELLFPAESSALELLSLEKQIFDDVLVDTVLISVKEQGDRDAIDFQLESLEEELLELPGIAGVLSPPRELRDDLFRQRNEESGAQRIILKIRGDLSEAERANLHSAIEDSLEEREGLRLSRAGSFFTSREVAETVSRESEKVVPLVGFTLFLAIFLCLRSLLDTVRVLGSSLLALATSLLIFSITGFPLGPVSQLAPPFLLAVGTSFHLHLFLRIRKTAPEERDSVIRELSQSVFLAAATTAGSLLTLVFMDVTDVTRFSVLAAFGTMLAALYARLQLTSPWGISYNASSASFYRLADYFRLRTRAPMVGSIVLLCAVLGVGVNQLHIHTDPLRFLPESSRGLQSIREVQKAFPGTHYLSLLFQIPDGEGQLLDSFDALERSIAAFHGVSNTVSPSDFNRVLEKKISSKFISSFRIRDSHIPSEFLSADGRHLRMLVESRYEGNPLLRLRDEITQQVRKQGGLVDRSFLGLTSLELVMAEQTSSITTGLITSLGTTLLALFGLTFLLFRSFVVALVGLVPNVIPLLSVFGTLGLTNGELDFGSCLVATAALGIAVDNTFHFLISWKEKRRSGESNSSAIDATVVQAAQPFILTSFSLSVAFSTMLFADSAPVAHFGGLLGVTLIAGLFADLIVLPLLLTRFSRSVA